MEKYKKRLLICDLCKKSYIFDRNDCSGVRSVNGKYLSLCPACFEDYARFIFLS